MGNRRKIIYATLFIVLSLILLMGMTYAWFISNNELVGEDISIVIGNKDTSIDLEVKVNSGEYELCSTKEDLVRVFYNTKPSDVFYFRVTITNNGDQDSNNLLQMSNIENDYLSDEYYDFVYEGDKLISKTLKENVPDVLDYFYIQNLSVDYYSKASDDSPANSDSIIYADATSIKSIMNQNNITLFSDKANQAGGKIVCGFSLIYNEESTIQGVNINIENITIIAN